MITLVLCMVAFTVGYFLGKSIGPFRPPYEDDL